MWIIIIFVVMFVAYIFLKSSNPPIDTLQLAREIEIKNAASEWIFFKHKLGHENINDSLEFFIDEFYINDYIKVKNVLENLELIKNPWRKVIDEGGTISMKTIQYIPPAFSHYFIAAYPDVYLWSQKEWDSKNIATIEKIKKLSDEEMEKYLNNPREMPKFYRALINQYKSEVGNLECSKMYTTTNNKF